MTPPTADYSHPQEENLDPFKYIIMVRKEGPTGGWELEEFEPWAFVLKPDTDPHARVALAAYAESIRPHRPALATELDQILTDFR